MIDPAAAHLARTRVAVSAGFFVQGLVFAALSAAVPASALGVARSFPGVRDSPPDIGHPTVLGG